MFTIYAKSKILGRIFISFIVNHSALLRVLSLLIFVVIGMYIEHRDDKNTHPKTKGVHNE